MTHPSSWASSLSSTQWFLQNNTLHNSILQNAQAIRQTLNELVIYLQFPSRRDYGTAWWEFCTSLQLWLQACYTLSALTFRPCLLLLWLVLQKGLYLSKIVGQFLFHGLYVSLQKGYVQVKWGFWNYVRWQSSLSWTQVKIQVGLMGGVIVLLSLRRYMEKQGYFHRVSRWYQNKKRCAIQSYRVALDKISRTSLLLAMILPHALFLTFGITIKVLFPSVITWLATETYAIFILSQLYPWIWTVALLFQYRHADQLETGPKVQSEATRLPLKEQKQKSSLTIKSFNNPVSVNTKSIKKRMAPKPFSRTTPKNPKHKERSAVALTTAARRTENYSMEYEARYWWQFWTLYCLVTGIGRVIYLVPIFGRLVTRTTLLQTTTTELTLFWYIWIYGMSYVLTSTASTEADLQRSYMVRPLPFLTQQWSPVVQGIYHPTSNMISPATWIMMVEKVKSFLSVAVMVRLISDHSQAQLLELLEYAHPFLIPAITLLMPGFVTEYGVLYVNTIVPSAQNPTNSASLSKTMESLQYWVLHVLLSNLLQWWSGILWYVPFSTHFTFLLWCHLQYTSSNYYNLLELELQAFGLLPKGKRQLDREDLGSGGIPSMDQTMTISILRKLTQALPSAAGALTESPNGEDDVVSIQNEEEINEKDQSCNNTSELTPIGLDVGVSAANEVSLVDDAKDTTDENDSNRSNSLSDHQEETNLKCQEQLDHEENLDQMHDKENPTSSGIRRRSTRLRSKNKNKIDS